MKGKICFTSLYYSSFVKSAGTDSRTVARLMNHSFQLRLKIKTDKISSFTANRYTGKQQTKITPAHATSAQLFFTTISMANEVY